MSELKNKTTKKKGQSYLRIVSSVLTVGLIFLLTYFVYSEFGVGDVWFWIRDILMLILIVLLIIVAAAGVVGVMMLIRKKMGKL